MLRLFSKKEISNATVVQNRPQQKVYCTQHDSLIFNLLPPEIRIIVYELLFPPNTWHITCRDRRRYDATPDNHLIHRPCLINCDFSVVEWDYGIYNPKIAPWGEGHSIYCYRPVHRRCNLVRKPSRRLVPKFSPGKRNKMTVPEQLSTAWFIPVLLVCHRMYLEVLHHIYSKNRFILNGEDLECTHRWLYNISPEALHSLTIINMHFFDQALEHQVFFMDSVRVHKASENKSFALLSKEKQEANPMREKEEQKWERICHQLTNCSNLQQLYIKIIDTGRGIHEELTLAPLRAISVPVFMIQLPWPKKEMLHGNVVWHKHGMVMDGSSRDIFWSSDCGFQIVRPDRQTGDALLRAGDTDPRYWQKGPFDWQV